MTISFWVVRQRSRALDEEIAADVPGRFWALVSPKIAKSLDLVSQRERARARLESARAAARR
jgi:hypothetical protein